MRRDELIKLVATRNMVDRIAESDERVRQGIYRSCEMLSDKLNDISKAEIKARDRVNISLEEYKRMKKENEQLRYDNEQLRNYFAKLEFPVDLRIIPDSIRTEYSEDLMRSLVHWRIMFDVEGRAPFGKLPRSWE